MQSSAETICIIFKPNSWTRFRSVETREVGESLNFTFCWQLQISLGCMQIFASGKITGKTHKNATQIVESKAVLPGTRLVHAHKSQPVGKRNKKIYMPIIS